MDHVVLQHPAAWETPEVGSGENAVRDTMRGAEGAFPGGVIGLGHGPDVGLQPRDAGERIRVVR